MNVDQNTPMTPPEPIAPGSPAQSEPMVPSTSEQAKTSARKPIVVVTAIVGAVVLLGAVGTAVVGTIVNSTHSGSIENVAVDGVTGLDIEVAGSEVTVKFADVQEAELSGSRDGSWSLTRDEGELKLRNSIFGFGSWFDNWFDDSESVVLVLPESLRTAKSLSLDATLSGGSLTIDGDFTEADVNVSAGAFWLTGSVNELDVELSAGRADISVDGARSAEIELSAGRVSAELTGAALKSVTVDASAGSVDLRLPNVAYRVTEDVSAGSFKNSLEVSSTATRTLSVSISAGTVTAAPVG